MFTIDEQDRIAKKIENKLAETMPESTWEVQPPHITGRFAMRNDRRFGIFCDGFHTQLIVNLDLYEHAVADTSQD